MLTAVDADNMSCSEAGMAVDCSLLTNKPAASCKHLCSFLFNLKKVQGGALEPSLSACTDAASDLVYRRRQQEGV